MTPEQLHEFLILDHKTGLLFWKRREERTRQDKTFNTLYAGRAAGSLKSVGYIYIIIKQRAYLAHRIVWAMCNGRWPDETIDHRDGNGANNAPANLREATRAQQGQNTAPHRDGTSGHVGVSFNKRCKRWGARICINYKSQHLGWFNTAEEAAEAYAQAKATIHIFQPKIRKV